MKRRKLRLTPIRLISVVLICTVLSWIVYSAAADSATLKLTSSQSTVTQGSTFTVSLTENSSSPVSIVQAKITYDPALVALQSVDYTGSPFTTDNPTQEAMSGTGFITVGRYLVTSTGYPTGDNLVANLKFKAVGGSGSATFGISQSSSSFIYTTTDNANNSLSSVSGTTVKIQAVTSPPPSTPPPVSNPAGTTSSGTKTSGGTKSPASSSSSSTPTAAEPEVSTPTSVVTQPDTTSIPDPGTSKVSPNASLSTKLKFAMKPITLSISAVAIIGGLIYLGVKRWVMRPYGFSGASATAGAVGKVTTGTGAGGGFVGGPGIGGKL